MISILYQTAKYLGSYKGFNECQIGDIEIIAAKASQWVWSPMIWKDGFPKASNLIRAKGMAFEYSGKEWEEREVLERFSNYRHFIGRPCQESYLCFVPFDRVMGRKAFYREALDLCVRFDSRPTAPGIFYGPIKLISVKKDGENLRRGQ